MSRHLWDRWIAPAIGIGLSLIVAAVLIAVVVGIGADPNAVLDL